MAPKVRRRAVRSSRKSGRPPKTVLSSYIVEQCCKFWVYGIDDLAICAFLNIPKDAYNYWISKDKLVTIKTCDSENKLTHEQTLGFGALRDIMRQACEPRYIDRLEHLYQKAIGSENIAEARRMVMWILEKKFPQRYGPLADQEQRPSRKMTFEVKYRK